MKPTVVIFILGTLALSGCKKKGCTDAQAENYNPDAKKDDGSCTFAELQVPATYNFLDSEGNSTVNYAGQTDRLNQLDEMIEYLESGNTVVLSETAILDMFANTGGNGGGNFSFTSTKQLRDKCFAADTTLLLNWMDSIAVASADFASTASNGQAGTLTSGTNTRLYSANGIDYAEMIEKGIMGAVFLYQATNVYFGEDEMNVDNTVAVDPSAGEYFTEMEHHWDEAFGYFGVANDFPTNVTDILFWGKYCNERDADLGCNAIMMNSFLKGRAIIQQKLSTSSRDAEIEIIRKMWEKFCAAQAVDYLEEALSYFGTDNAQYLHELSEAYGFINALKYAPLETRVITYTEIDNLLNNVIGDNLWDVTVIDLNTAIDDLNNIYGF